MSDAIYALAYEIADLAFVQNRTAADARALIVSRLTTYGCSEVLALSIADEAVYF